VSLDAKIDELYKEPLDAFIPSRNALAKSQTGADAKRVRALAKPTVVPWAVNQVYWHARPVYDKAIKSGERLRAAQIASLEGRRGVDLREAGDMHRRALANAVKEAERLAEASGAKPAADALMRTFEALSLASASVEPAGRLTKPLQPAGFEALAGVTPKPPAPLAFKARESGGTGRTHGSAPTGEAHAPPKADRKRELAEAEAARKREAAIKAAAAAVARAEAAEQLARTAWEKSHDRLLEARQALTKAKSET
jgi:hypothetical protein